MKLAHVHAKPRQLEPVWHVQAAVLAAILLQIALNNKLSIGPKYIIGVIEVFLLVSLAILGARAKSLRHSLAAILIGVISFANIASLVLVIHSLFGGGRVNGKDLILSGMVIYFTNIIIFGLWYWELDSSGVQGQSTDVAPVDFLFPQMRQPADDPIRTNWQPTFFDYVYISITNAVAFSPNDTVPLTHRAKFLMTLQSLISVITVALVVTRAVTILA